jgi:hypothetical protein
MTMYVAEAAWDFTNKMAERGISFGVCLKFIRESLDSDNDDATKLHLIRMTMDLHKKEIDEFINKREPA